MIKSINGKTPALNGQGFLHEELKVSYLVWIASERNIAFNSQFPYLEFMNHSAKLYTKTGDGGLTRLLNGETVSKDDIRLEAQGCLDELSCYIGMLIEVLPETLLSEQPFLREIQSHLMKIMSVLSFIPKDIEAEMVQQLSVEKIEIAIDRIQNELPELKEFILPGGNVPAAWAHLARVSCRKAERRIVHLFSEYKTETPESETILAYINRLSDFLFILARLCN